MVECSCSMIVVFGLFAGGLKGGVQKHMCSMNTYVFCVLCRGVSKAVKDAMNETIKDANKVVKDLTNLLGKGDITKENSLATKATEIQARAKQLLDKAKAFK